MKTTYINIYTLLNQTQYWKNYELKKFILKFMLKSKKVSQKQKLHIKLIKWDLKKIKFISAQTNVCKKTGKFKKTFNQIGLSRHALRFHLNEDRLMHLKKLSW